MRSRRVPPWPRDPGLSGCWAWHARWPAAASPARAPAPAARSAAWARRERIATCSGLRDPGGARAAGRPRPPRAPRRRPAAGVAAPLFMLDLYRAVAGDDDEDGGAPERRLGRADLVMSFVNMGERGPRGRAAATPGDGGGLNGPTGAERERQGPCAPPRAGGAPAGGGESLSWTRTCGRITCPAQGSEVLGMWGSVSCWTDRDGRGM